MTMSVEEIEVWKAMADPKTRYSNTLKLLIKNPKLVDTINSSDVKLKDTSLLLVLLTQAILVKNQTDELFLLLEFIAKNTKDFTYTHPKTKNSAIRGILSTYDKRVFDYFKDQEGIIYIGRDDQSELTYVQASKNIENAQKCLKDAENEKDTNLIAKEKVCLENAIYMRNCIRDKTLLRALEHDDLYLLYRLQQAGDDLKLPLSNKETLEGIIARMPKKPEKILKWCQAGKPKLEKPNLNVTPENQREFKTDHASKPKPETSHEFKSENSSSSKSRLSKVSQCQETMFTPDGRKAYENKMKEYEATTKEQEDKEAGSTLLRLEEARKFDKALMEFHKHLPVPPRAPTSDHADASPGPR